MPGTVVTVPVSAGDVVSARQPLVVLEAMKMELPVTAPFDGKVASIHVAPGERVAGGQLLVELESPR
jgi:biotin carboxyl carrier protein